MNCLTFLNKSLQKCKHSIYFSTKPTWESTTPFKPPIKKGYVIKVYDGDTITIASKLPYRNSKMYRWSVRIRGIDCPEMKTNNNEEKNIAKIAQSTLSDMILHKHVKLENVNNDKYGRVLADVIYKNRNISTFMLENKLAVPYFGKTKIPPKSWLNYYNGQEEIISQNNKKKAIKKGHVKLDETFDII